MIVTERAHHLDNQAESYDVGLQLATGYTIGFLIYQIGTLITTGALGAGFVGGLIAVIGFAAIIIGIILNNKKKMVAQYSLKAA